MFKEKFALVLVARSGQKEFFSYSIPESIIDQLQVGHVVKVPLKNKTTFGVVWEINEIKPNYPLKPIKAIIDLDLKLSSTQRTLAVWMSKAYLAPLSDCVFLFLPVLTKSVGAILESPADGSPLRFTSHGGQAKPTPAQVVKLTKDQTRALSVINASTKPMLLYGVTGSGKTEIYLQLAQKTLAQKKSVLVLVPEIALTPQTLTRFAERFGGKVAAWHSQLSQRERRVIFWQIWRDEISVVVGSRSALFLPFQNLGLIIIDEEHENSFYQESSPRYQTKEVARKLSDLTNSKLVLGSATPSLESIHQVSMIKYDFSKLENRINQQKLPETVLVDLRSARLNGGLISDPLKKYIFEALEQKQQVVLLLNRRGTAASIMCTDCGQIIFCPQCNVPLTYHSTRRYQALRCHHCDFTEPLPAECPSCKSVKLKHFGSGTEKGEAEIQQLFPNAKILRMDRDTTGDRDGISKMYHQFAEGKFDILLGTQMIAKGWDIANVGLVGILLAESGLMLPDFRAAERTASLLIQASGRSGRGKNRGLTVIQTYRPEHAVVRFAAKHEYGAFAQEELKSRREFNYPPFCTLIRLLFQHTDLNKCENETKKVCLALEKDLPNIEIVGPSSCFYDRIRGKFRYHILIKAKENQVEDVKLKISGLEKPWVIEINPENVL